MAITILRVLLQTALQTLLKAVRCIGLKSSCMNKYYPARMGPEPNVSEIPGPLHREAIAQTPPTPI
jgi:hypothetical protein